MIPGTPKPIPKLSTFNIPQGIYYLCTLCYCNVHVCYQYSMGYSTKINQPALTTPIRFPKYLGIYQQVPWHLVCLHLLLCFVNTNIWSRHLLSQEL